MPNSVEAEKFIDRMTRISNVSFHNLRVLEYGVDDGGVAYAVIAPVEGSNLAYMHRKVSQVERILDGVLERVASLHEVGIVCGDLCPGSFLLGKAGEVIWLGVIGSFEIEAQSTAAAPPIVTYHYLSPEQRSGSAPTASSDAYSLAVLCYYLFSGRYPIGDDKRIILGAPQLKEIAPIESLVSDVPVWARKVLPKSFGLDPGGRFANAIELLRQIKAIRNNEEDVSDIGAEGKAQGGSLVKFGERTGDIAHRDDRTQLKSGARPPKGSDNVSEHYGAIENSDLPEGNLKTNNNFNQIVIFIAVGLVLSIVGSVSIYVLSTRDYTPQSSPLVIHDRSRSQIESLLKAVTQSATLENYENVVALAGDLKIKQNRDLLKEVEQTIIKVASDTFGDKVGGRLAEVLEKDILNSCYRSLLSIFSPNLATQMKGQYINECLVVNSTATSQLLSLIALKPSANSEWSDLFLRVAHDVFQVDSAQSRTPIAVVLSRVDLRGLHTEEDIAQLLTNLTAEDLLWLFGALKLDDEAMQAMAATEILRRDLIPLPRSELLKFFVNREHVNQDLKAGLIKAVGGNITEDTIALAGVWLHRSSSDILLALCSQADANLIKLKAFETLASRKITQEPAGSWIAYLRSNSELWKRKVDYLSIICDVQYFDHLNSERKEAFLKSLGKYVDDSIFINILLKHGSPILVREATKSFGKGYSPNLLMSLLKYKDKETRIAAIQHLKFYNDLFVLRDVVEAFKREKDPDVQAVYRENFWAVRKHESGESDLEEVSKGE